MQLFKKTARLSPDGGGGHLNGHLVAGEGEASDHGGFAGLREQQPAVGAAVSRPKAVDVSLRAMAMVRVWMVGCKHTIIVSAHRGSNKPSSMFGSGGRAGGGGDLEDAVRSGHEVVLHSERPADRCWPPRLI